MNEIVLIKSMIIIIFAALFMMKAKKIMDSEANVYKAINHFVVGVILLLISFIMYYTEMIII